MRIGINALLLGERPGYRQTGVSRYIAELTQELPRAMAQAEFILFRGRIPEEQSSGVTTRQAWWPVERPTMRIAWEALGLAVDSRRAHLDLFHGTVNALPPLLPCPAVVTIHDLALLKWPDLVPAARYRYLKHALVAAARRARRIIAVSESTKRDIVEMLQVEPARIAVTPLAVSEQFRPAEPAEIERLRADLGLAGPYVLSVGTLEPRKNLPRLLRAFARLIADPPHSLVLAGPVGWRTDELRAALATPGLAARVRQIGFVDDGDLPALYGGAELFAFPSLYEGFGLPVLEAMACGAPVVTSNVSALPDIAGDAALLVDPSDEEAIAAAMQRCLGDAALRADLRRRGLTRAAQFSWARTAELTAAVYREAAA